MIKLICIGNVKEKYLKDAINDYQKRINKYIKFEIIQLNDYAYDTKKTILKEQEEILKVINLKNYNILLDLEGTSYTSLDFAKHIEKIININRDITFIIGGSYGVSEEIKKKCQERISFSKLTFPHQLFRVIFLEQLYRSFKIINNEKYHK